MSVKDESKYPNEFDAMMRNEITVWRDFHNYWIKQARETILPVYFCRYEDIIAEPDKEISEIFKFMLNVNNIEGIFV